MSVCPRTLKCLRLVLDTHATQMQIGQLPHRHWWMGKGSRVGGGWQQEDQEGERLQLVDGIASGISQEWKKAVMDDWLKADVCVEFMQCQ